MVEKLAKDVKTPDDRVLDTDDSAIYLIGTGEFRVSFTVKA